MIESDNELRIVKEQIEFLRKARDHVFTQTDSDPFMMHLSASSFEKKMRQLWEEVDEYEARVGISRPDDEKFKAPIQPAVTDSAPASGLSAG
jgi:hypothetical protein